MPRSAIPPWQRLTLPERRLQQCRMPLPTRPVLPPDSSGWAWPALPAVWMPPRCMRWPRIRNQQRLHNLRRIPGSARLAERRPPANSAPSAAPKSLRIPILGSAPNAEPPTRESSAPNAVRRSPRARLFTNVINAAGSRKIRPSPPSSALSAVIRSTPATSSDRL